MAEHGFRFHEHTADITIECWAPTLELAFAEAALATFEVIMDTSTVEADTPTPIVVSGFDLSELLVEWIGKIIALIDLEYRFYRKFEVVKLVKDENGYSLDGLAWGEEIDFDRHVTRTEVKAMTYADLRIDTQENLTTIWFTLDL
ncbi:MAG: archease [Candidatus Thorarchaeota archaeon]